MSAYFVMLQEYYILRKNMFRGTKDIYLKASILFGCNIYYEIDKQRFLQLYIKKKERLSVVAGSPSVSLLRDLGVTDRRVYSHRWGESL